MKALRSSRWDKELKSQIVQGVPLLGICLGMQILADSGTEGGETEGLGLIPGRVEKLDGTCGLRIPHVGWNEVEIKKEIALFSGIESGKDFYFLHSYHFATKFDDNRIADTTYGARFVSAVGKGHVVGTQFHPEKSLRIGFQLLRNFLNLY
jgi:imidazole glycerol-phosphate synthase subunit HisH